MSQSFYGGFLGNAGAMTPDELLAGNPSFDINRGSGPQLPLAYNASTGAVPMGNAAFFAGPQMGQLPPGYTKTIS